jgi:hypothetical protein
MTYQEIVRAIESLSPQERQSLLKSLDLERGNRETSAPTQPQIDPSLDRLLDEDVIHAIDRDGNRHDYQIEDLIWNPHSYDYIKNQSHAFKLALPQLIHKYAGKYVVFEDGQVIDSDGDRDLLLDRVCETDFYKQREAIYCELVPQRLEIDA